MTRPSILTDFHNLQFFINFHEEQGVIFKGLIFDSNIFILTNALMTKCLGNDEKIDANLKICRNISALRTRSVGYCELNLQGVTAKRRRSVRDFCLHHFSAKNRKHNWTTLRIYFLCIITELHISMLSSRI